MRVVVKFNITPTKRGADEPEVTETPDEMEYIGEILDFGKGFIKVKYANGVSELREGGTISWRYNNPGNLKFGPFAKENGAIGPGDGNHAVFPTLEVGEHAMKELLFSPARGYNKMSIIAMLQKYAPVSDGNNPTGYAKFITERMGVSQNTVIEKLSARQKADMIEAMKTAEGFMPGRVTVV